MKLRCFNASAFSQGASPQISLMAADQEEVGRLSRESTRNTRIIFQVLDSCAFAKFAAICFDLRSSAGSAAKTTDALD
jgi:hypothetical protein